MAVGRRYMSGRVFGGRVIGVGGCWGGGGYPHDDDGVKGMNNANVSVNGGGVKGWWCKGWPSPAGLPMAGEGWLCVWVSRGGGCEYVEMGGGAVTQTTMMM